MNVPCHQLKAWARVQRHRGFETRVVQVPHLGALLPNEAMELALSLLDAARAALQAPAPDYPGLFEHVGDPMGSEWTPLPKRRARR